MILVLQYLSKETNIITKVDVSAPEWRFPSGPKCKILEKHMRRVLAGGPADAISRNFREFSGAFHVLITFRHSDEESGGSGVMSADNDPRATTSFQRSKNHYESRRLCARMAISRRPEMQNFGGAHAASITGRPWGIVFADFLGIFGNF